VRFENARGIARDETGFFENGKVFFDEGEELLFFSGFGDVADQGENGFGHARYLASKLNIVNPLVFRANMRVEMVRRRGKRSVAAASISAMERPLGGPEIEVNVANDAIVLGAFQRASEIGDTKIGPIAQRASGGAAVRVGDGTVHLALALPTIDALVVDCTPQKILNRYVRPLLKAITRVSIIASYFGRDWVSAGHRPCAYVAFAHDSSSQRTMFEAFVAVRTPFALGPRASFMGKEPATLGEIAKKTIDPENVAEEIVRAYASAYALEVEDRPIDDEPRVASEADLLARPPWLARVDEAIGPIFADKTHIGGEFMASRDAVNLLHIALRVGADPPRAIDEAFKNPAVALEGVRSLRSFHDAIARARSV